VTTLWGGPFFYSSTMILCTNQNPFDWCEVTWLACTKPEHQDELERWPRHQTSVPGTLHFVN